MVIAQNYIHATLSQIDTLGKAMDALGLLSEEEEHQCFLLLSCSAKFCPSQKATSFSSSVQKRVGCQQTLPVLPLHQGGCAPCMEGVTPEHPSHWRVQKLFLPFRLHLFTVPLWCLSELLSLFEIQQM